MVHIPGAAPILSYTLWIPIAKQGNVLNSHLPSWISWREDDFLLDFNLAICGRQQDTKKGPWIISCQVSLSHWNSSGPPSTTRVVEKRTIEDQVISYIK